MKAKAIYNGELIEFNYETKYDLDDFVRNNLDKWTEDMTPYDLIRIMVQCYSYQMFESYLPTNTNYDGINY